MNASFATECKCAQIYRENRPAVITVLTVVTDWYRILGHSGTETPFAPDVCQVWFLSASADGNVEVSILSLIR